MRRGMCRPPATGPAPCPLPLLAVPPLTGRPMGHGAAVRTLCTKELQPMAANKAAGGNQAAGHKAAAAAAAKALLEPVHA